MAKEIAISKRVKISQAQQNMLLAVLGASVVLGVAISLILHFIQQISFNTKVIMAEEESIATYSKVIKNAGICEAPKGDTYSKEELAKCDPDSIATSQVPNTLRYNILNNIAANQGLNSVPRGTGSDCINPDTDKNYTYKDLESMRKNANNSSELAKANQLMELCSALRVIPDALPAFENPEALLASLNKLSIDSGLGEPESLSSAGSGGPTTIPGLYYMSFNLSMEGNTGAVVNALNYMERSIREINMSRASIEWKSDGTISLSTQAEAYYTEASTVSESTKTITAEGK